MDETEIGYEPLSQTGEAKNLPIEEVLQSHYSTGVIIPYSSNMHIEGPEREDGTYTYREPGTPYLSAFSALATVSAAQLYKDGKIQNILLCGETTFGENNPTTSDLMRNKLIQLGIPKDAIQQVEKDHLDNTPMQVQALAEHQKTQGDNRYLMVDWDFHDGRVRKHADAYRLKADTVTVEDTLGHYFENLNLDRYQTLLEQFESREKSLPIKLLTGKKGELLKLISKFRGGSVTDIEVTTDETGNKNLNLVDSTGKAKLKEVTQES
jgi:hypothetical protein